MTIVVGLTAIVGIIVCGFGMRNGAAENRPTAITAAALFLIAAAIAFK